jgi:hypothetical protein
MSLFSNVGIRSWKKLRISKDQDEEKVQEKDEAYMVRSLKQVRKEKF